MAGVQRQPRKSMWEKSREKKAARRYHSRNFIAGHVAPDEHYLSRTGLRGRKRWIFLAIFLLIYIVAVAHLLLTSIILGVLQFDASGPPYFIFTDNSLVWPQGARISDVRVANSILSYRNESLAVKGQQNSVIFQAGRQRNTPSGDETLNSSQIIVNQSTVRFHPFTSMSIMDDGEQLFSANASHVMLPALPSLQKLVATRVTTNTVRAGGQNSLDVAAGANLVMNGARRVFLGGGHVNMTGGNGLTFSVRSNEALIQLEGSEGIRFLGLPVPSTDVAPSTAVPKYHLCACSNGKVFRVPVNPQRCAAAVNPCN